MDMTTKIIIGAMFILLLINAPIGVSDANAVQTFPLPIAELRQVTQNWLGQGCDAISDHELPMGIIQLSCKRDNQNLRVTLTPRSALATQLAISSDQNNSKVNDLEDQLSAYIEEYLAPTTEKDGISDQITQIPAAVLAKSDAVVCIQSAADQSTVQVSGFIIDQKGTIICTTHGLRQFKTITFTDSKGRTHEGEVVKSDPKTDLALIRTTIKPPAHISLINSKRTLLQGTLVYSIGCPVNQANTVTAGTVNQPPVRANQLVYWQVNMEILPGSSGSPVFDRQGMLVGMIKGRYREDNSIGFLIPADRIKHFINEF